MAADRVDATGVIPDGYAESYFQFGTHVFPQSSLRGGFGMPLTDRSFVI